MNYKTQQRFNKILDTSSKDISEVQSHTDKMSYSQIDNELENIKYKQSLAFFDLLFTRIDEVEEKLDIELNKL